MLRTLLITTLIASAWSAGIMDIAAVPVALVTNVVDTLLGGDGTSSNLDTNQVLDTTTTQVLDGATNAYCTATSPSARIVGGKCGEIENFPSQGILMYQGDVGYFSGQAVPENGPLNYSTMCGCTIIHNRYVLTAAHCCAVDDFKTTAVRVGTNEYYKGETHYIKDFTIHPQYNADLNEYDACVVELATSIVFGPNKQPSKLYRGDSEKDFQGKNLVTSGYGTEFSFSPATSAHLMYVEVPYVNRATCNEQYDGQIGPTEVCAGAAAKDSCQGDSGGPLFATGLSTPPYQVQVGIVSWGEFCGVPGKPGVYCYIPTVADWILSIIGVVF